MERFTTVLLVAGLGFFALAFVLSGAYPYAITDARTPEASIEELARDVSDDFKQLRDAYPVAFSELPGADRVLSEREIRETEAGSDRISESDAAWREAYAHALRRGRDRYVAEACWHCHSQFVRPAANEEQRYGPVQTTAHDNNALQRPVLWGTRRVGPDLTHEGGKRSNDWHVAHLWDPESTSPDSVMPEYRWLFREGFQVWRRIELDAAEREGLSPATRYAYPGVYDTREEAEAALRRLAEEMPAALVDEAARLQVEAGRGLNAEGIGLVAYLQWLGTWEPPAGTEEDDG